MRTTLNIDEDVLLAAKELAAKEKKSAGKILSEYFRRALTGVGPAVGEEGAAPAEGMMKNGIPILPSRGELVTIEKVADLSRRAVGDLCATTCW